MTDQSHDGAVAENQAHAGTVTGPRPAERYRGMIMAFASNQTADRSGEIMLRQVDSIMNAAEHGSVDDIWDADSGGTIQCRDADGLEVRIYDLEYVKSNRPDIQSATGVYATMNAAVLGGPRDILQKLGISVGDEIVLQTGAEMFHAKVRAFQAREMLPIDGVVTSLDTSSGNAVVKFLRMPERSHPGNTAQ